MSGAGARPDARYTWDLVQDTLSTTEDARLDEDPKMGAPELSWFKFLLILTAHGWFLRPRAFPLQRDGSKGSVTPSDAMRRVYVFVLAWLLAFLLLPTLWVVAAAAVWIALLTPGLIEIHKQFQNEHAGS